MIIEDSEPNTKIATIFGVTESAIRRHKEGHIPTALAKSQQALDVAAADSLLVHAQKLEAKAWSLLIQAEKNGDFRTAIQGVKAAKDCLEFHARISGELAPEKILLQLEPAISRIVLIIKQEVRDEDTLAKISERLLQEPLSEGGIIDV